MNHKKIYELLIEKAKNRTMNVQIYTETHHIIPRCLGGTEDAFNLVELTGREHFIAHVLLAKIHGGPLIHAAHMMSNMGRYNNRSYAWLREAHAKRISDLMKGKPKSEEHIKNLISTMTPERNKKISDALTNIPKTKEAVQNQIESRKNGAGWVCPEWKKEKQAKEMVGQGNPMFGQTHTIAAREKIRQANLQKISCPHCEKSGGISIMKRWHFDNCKLSPNFIERKKYPKVRCPHCHKMGGGSQMVNKHFDNCKMKPKGNKNA